MGPRQLQLRARPAGPPVRAHRPACRDGGPSRGRRAHETGATAQKQPITPDILRGICNNMGGTLVSYSVAKARRMDPCGAHLLDLPAQERQSSSTLGSTLCLECATSHVSLSDAELAHMSREYDAYAKAMRRATANTYLPARAANASVSSESPRARRTSCTGLSWLATHSNSLCPWIFPPPQLWSRTGTTSLAPPGSSIWLVDSGPPYYV